MRVLRRRVVRVSTVAAVLCLSVCIVAPAAVVHAAPPGASAYVPVSPYRILDTRIGQGFPQRGSMPVSPSPCPSRTSRRAPARSC